MSSSTTSATGTVRAKRSRTRRAGESMFGMLLLTRNIVLILGSLLLLVAGGWTSWESTGPALTGDVRGTVRIAKCTEERCAGTFIPAAGGGSPVRKVTIDKTASGTVGERLQVALRPGTKEVVRTGPSGVLHGAVPFGGSLLLAALVLMLGMRMKRTALVLGVLGAGLMGASWALLTF